MTPKVSICIPIHQTPKTAFYLSRLLKSVSEQTFTDYEIVVTDEGAMARNHNAALMKGKGEILMFLQMDDYFSHPTSLRNIYYSYDADTKWQITGCLHDRDGVVGWPHDPEWTDDIFLGNNRLGGASTFSIRRENLMLFEEPLSWVVDCDLYWRLYLKYGLPKLLNSKNVVVDQRTDRTSHTLSDKLKVAEIEYAMKKYGK